MHARQYKEERKSFPSRKFKRAAERLCKERALQNVSRDNHEQNLPKPRRRKQESNAIRRKPEKRIHVTARIAHKEHPGVCSIVSRERVLFRRVEVSMREEPREVPCDKERQSTSTIATAMSGSPRQDCL